MIKKVLCALFLLALLVGCADANAGSDKVTLKDLKYGGSRNNILYVRENEEYVPYLCFGKSANSVLLVRKDALDNSVMFNDIGFDKYYQDSNLDLWLNQSLYESYDADFKELILNTGVEVYNGSVSKTSVISRKVFVLSLSELGLHDTYCIDEGISVSGIRDFDLVDEQWTRSVDIIDNHKAVCYSEETHKSVDMGEELKVRPCFTLDSSLEIEACVESDKIDGYVLCN